MLGWLEKHQHAKKFSTCFWPLVAGLFLLLGWLGDVGKRAIDSFALTLAFDDDDLEDIHMRLDVGRLIFAFIAALLALTVGVMLSRVNRGIHGSLWQSACCLGLVINIHLHSS